MTQLTNSPTVGQRIASMFLDHFIITFIVVIGSLIPGLPLAFLTKNIKTSWFTNFSGGVVVIITFILASLYLNKDILNGRSAGKRITKLQVVDNDTELTATPMKCLLRNLTIIIFPIEVLITLFNPMQRLGDKLANTKVVLFDERKEKEKLDRRKVLMTLLVGVFAFIAVFIVTIIFQALVAG